MQVLVCLRLRVVNRLLKCDSLRESAVPARGSLAHQASVGLQVQGVRGRGRPPLQAQRNQPVTLTTSLNIANLLHF